VQNSLNFKKENKMKNEKQTTLRFYLFNDKNKEVMITLSDANMTLLYIVFEFKDEKELYTWLLEDMQAEFSANTYESFDELKHDFENNIDEILDEAAKHYAIYQQIYPLYQKIEAICQQIISKTFVQDIISKKLKLTAPATFASPGSLDPVKNSTSTKKVK
jgi:hypothetical protein